MFRKLERLSVSAAAMLLGTTLLGCVSLALPQEYALLAKSSNSSRGEGLMAIAGSTNYCVTIYRYNEFLLILTAENADPSRASVSVYDKRLGVAYTGTSTRNSVNAKCELTDRYWAATFNGLAMIIAPDFKALFDDGDQNPSDLAKAITAGPPYYRYDGKFNGKRGAIHAIGYTTPRVNLQGAEDWLRKQTPNRVKLIFANALDVEAGLRD